MEHRGQHDLIMRCIDRRRIAAQAGQTDVVRFDLLCHLALNAPVVTRRQGPDRVKKKQAAISNYLSPEAREILDDLLEKYASDGELQITLPDVLKLLPNPQECVI
ncbi:MAG: box helicase [Verrucomicrobiales bacterium]|nr:box helicase [Verrucomicrobiales bacterium]